MITGLCPPAMSFEPDAPVRSSSDGQAATPSPTRARKGTKRMRLLLVLASFVTMALLSEGAVRIASAISFPRMMEIEDTLGWRHMPNREKRFVNEDGEELLTRHDAHGHRRLPDTLESSSRTTNVLVLGDSFTEAAQVSSADAFTGRLAQADPTLNVLNAGVGGYSTIQQYIYLREHGKAFAPDLVLLVAYENDLTDNCLPYSPGVGGRPWARLDGDAFEVIEDYDDEPYLRFVAPVPFKRALIRHSYLFYGFNDRVWRKWNKERLDQMELEDWSALDAEEAQFIFLEMVDRMHALAGQLGAEFAVVLIPSATALKAGDDPWRGVAASFAEADRFPFVSLWSALSDPSSGRCYFERDIHWTRQGHAVAAEEMIPVVQEALASRQ